MAALSKEQKRLFDNLSTKLQKETALFYIKNDFENGAQSYLKACKKLNKNPAKNTATAASEILNAPNVKEFLESVRKPKEHENAEEAIGTFEQKRAVLWDVVQKCSSKAQVIGSNGEPEFIFDARAVTGAIGELNKMDGDLATQKHSHKVLNINDLSDDELEAKLAQLERAFDAEP